MTPPPLKLSSDKRVFVWDPVAPGSATECWSKNQMFTWGCKSAVYPPVARRNRRGVSIIEMLIVMMMIGTITAFALPKVRAAQTHESTRSARREVQTSLARAKGSAVQRGCRATLHMDDDNDKIWVTACKVTGTGLDTLGGVVYLAARYGVQMETDADSIPFGPNSLGLGAATINLAFIKSGYTSSMQITPIGRPIW